VCFAQNEPFDFPEKYGEYWAGIIWTWTSGRKEFVELYAKYLRLLLRGSP
jgi:hypothetical protein